MKGKMKLKDKSKLIKMLLVVALVMFFSIEFVKQEFVMSQQNKELKIIEQNKANKEQVYQNICEQCTGENREKLYEEKAREQGLVKENETIFIVSAK